MQWLRYFLLTLTPLVLTCLETNTIILFSRIDTITVIELAANISQLLALVYIWRNPPQSKEAIDPIGMFKEEIKLRPPLPREPSQVVLDAADRLKLHART